MAKKNPRAEINYDPRDTIILQPGETAPPVRVILPNGEYVTMDQINAMSDDEFNAWYANMQESNPSEIEQ